MDTQTLDLLDSIERLEALLEEAANRGLRMTGPPCLSKLAMLRDEFAEMGASHTAALVGVLHTSMASVSGQASVDILLLQANIRVLRRCLALETARPLLSALAAESDART